MNTYHVLSLCAAAGALLLSLQAQAELGYPEANTLVPDGYTRYAVSPFPDRVILLPGQNPATVQSVNWRTNSAVEDSVLQISPAQHTPGLHLTARNVMGTFSMLETQNGVAHHHSVTIDDLEPDTLYAYRVKGENTWSAWFQFRTPKVEFDDYTALYFGDAQNAIRSHYTRTVNEAILTAPRAQVMLYAGDLVNSRYGVHDDEWGEWFEAKGWIGSSISQLPATGNHEFIEDEHEYRHLVEHWPAQFKVAGNGPEGLEDTVYYVDYQGVRYIALDSTEAMQSDDKARIQADWMREILAHNPNKWTIAFHHHPMFSVSLGRDNPPLREHWQPVYEEFGVDLVLQGHDHTYGRGHDIGKPVDEDAIGPMYVVSVAGPKMYLVSDEAAQSMNRNAEDVQLFQTLDFSADRLTYRSITVTGELYDAFDLVRGADGSISVEDKAPNTPEIRCANPSPMRETRCWNGTELIHAPAQGDER